MAECERLAGVAPDVVVRERLYLRALVTAIERHWGRPSAR